MSSSQVPQARLQELATQIKRRPLSQAEYRRLTGLSKSYVSEIFIAAELLGLIRPTTETWRDRTRRINGPPSRVYEWQGGDA